MSEDAWLTVTGRVRIARSRRTLRVRAVRNRLVAAASPAVIAIRLPRSAVRVVLRIVARDAAGNAVVRTRTIRLSR